ncbi:MAG: nucleoid occlusion factor SlmA [Pseudomonadales bacterium]
MPHTEKKTSRRQGILQALAHHLEHHPGKRITTAALAREVGVSEAALYRHFPSKFKMFEGLIEFVEEAIFSRVNVITAEQSGALDSIAKILSLILTFCEKNPGITRILTGDAITGENEKLHARVVQFFDRIELQIKQILREAEIREGLRTVITVSATANLLMAAADGRIHQYVRSEFKRRPTEYWSEQLPILLEGMVRKVDSSLSSNI